MIDLPEGARVGPYRVVGPLGAGGMARVYRAIDETLGREVALKVLLPGSADDEGRARFLREARALARIEHENVVRVFASGEDDDIAWMALAYVHGDPLSALVGPDGIDEESACALCAQVARGLAAVHGVGVVHRDVKPDNLIVDDEATVKILDFGVAQIQGVDGGGFVTRAGVVVGTPHFMAPEQARGAPVDARADAWGLGATLFLLLCGRPPFWRTDNDADLDILARVLREQAPDVRACKPTVSAAAAVLVARLLTPAADDRLADMDAIAKELESIARALARGEAPAAVPPPAQLRPAARLRPVARPIGAIAVGVVLFAVVGVGGVVVGRVLAGPPAAEVRASDLTAPGVANTQPTSTEPPPTVPTPLEPLPFEREESPPTPPPPTAASEAQGLIGRGEDPRAVLELVRRDDAVALEAVRIVVASDGNAGDATIWAIARERALQHQAALADALFAQRSSARALKAVEALQVLRTDASISLLDRTSREHPDKKVQRAARAARESLFRVED